MSGGELGVLPVEIITDASLPCHTLRVLMLMSAVTVDGVVCVSQAELARRLNVKPQSVSESLRHAAERGLIKRVTSTSGTVTWRLMWHQAVPDASGQDGHDHQAVPDASRTRTRAGLTPPVLRTGTTGVKSICLSEDETAKVHARYDATMGAAMVTNQISTALSNKKVSQYTDYYLYVMNWLRKSVQWDKEHEARMATEKARLERARTPYRPAVQEPKSFLGRNIRDIVGPAPEGYEDRFMKENHFGESAG
jgi:hypothetical protein